MYFQSSCKNHHTSKSSFFAALCLSLLFVLSGRSHAENPWGSSSMGWGSMGSGWASPAWSSWNSTGGGTFNNPFLTHHTSRLGAIPAVPSLPSPAVHNSEIDPAMIRAGSIAEQRAQSHSTMFCWRYVKEALVAAGSVSSYPQTAYAKEAGRELVDRFGFVQLSVRSAESAPIGSVLVYGGPGAGHVELRTTRGFVSDFRSAHASNLPFIGAFTRLDHHRHSEDTAQVVLPNGPVGS